MKKIFISILLLSLMLLICDGIMAQTDSRNRKPETVVADGIAQLPAATSKTYNRIMKEMAETGETGINLLASMLRPASEADNSKPEYAINGIVNYVSASGQESLRKPIHDALVKAFADCSDNPNRYFILSQITKLATPSDFPLYAGLLGDSYLRVGALEGLAQIKGIDDKVSMMINDAAAPDADLAYLAYFRKLKDVEPQLLKWIGSKDSDVKEAALNALSVCGTEASVKALSAEVNRDPYLQLLNNLGQSRTVVSESKKLIKDKNQSIRCAGLRLLLKSDPKNATKNVITALSDNNAEYRHTALLNSLGSCGENIVEEVANKYNKLSPASKTDVIRWLGNIHATDQIGLVCGAIDSEDPVLSQAAVEAASKIGGEKALEALLCQLNKGGDKANIAYNALLSFNGNINNGVLKSLDSENPATVCSALALASTRHLHNAYTKAVELTNSSDQAVKNAAYRAIDGIATASEFPDLCNMLEASKGEATALIQQAAKSAIAPLDADKQYELIYPRILNAKDKSLYLPLLAQCGNDSAINLIVKEYEDGNKKIALNALLEISNPAVIPILYDIAAKSSEEEKDRILKRYVSLVDKSTQEGLHAYFLYSRALDLNPGADIKKLIINSLSKYPTLPAAMLAASWINDPTTGFYAASTFTDILNGNAYLRRGDSMKKISESTIPVFQAQKDKGNADAGYSIDRVTGFLADWDSKGGFKTLQGEKPAECNNSISLPGKPENFELYLEFKPYGEGWATLRGMDLIKWNIHEAIFLHGDNKVPLAEGWNTLHVRMQDDRVTIDIDGIPVSQNEMLNTIPGTDKKAPVSGDVKFNGKFEYRNFYYEILPSTPTYTLSDEEKEQGFELLFDGRSLENFHGNTTAYIPQDGTIYVTAQYGGQGNLYTKKNYSDFIFRFEFFFDVPAVNNGIGIRTGKDVTGVDAAYEGMEIQILDHDDPVYQGYPYGYTGLHPYQNHGSVYGIFEPEHIDFGPIKQWHTEEIKAVGDHITVTVDGKVVTDVNIRDAVKGHNVAPDGSQVNPYTLDHQNHPGLFNKEGYISFCGHGAGVKFRNVRVLDLSKEAQDNRKKSIKTKKVKK